ncbi:MAG: LuxR C-terminal-related transcriptional regulator [Alkalinema sp. CAN_BIN05]|nr:LuxR C-terminal-related transcriptional regulator [Alkalinema sp. CAN_BIN05]
MQMTLKQDFVEKLDILHRLSVGGSVVTFQQNLLAELKSILTWDQSILLVPEPWIIPLNQSVPFAPPSRPSPTGVWQNSTILDWNWDDWSRQVAKHYQLGSWLLITIELPSSNLTRQNSDPQQITILLLRNHQEFIPTEIRALSIIYTTLQQMLDQAIILDYLFKQSYTMSKTISNTMPNFDTIEMKHQPEPCIRRGLRSLGLTPRQVEVMHLIIKGQEVTEIAGVLGCCESTVRKHLENLYRRLGVQTRTAAIAQVLKTLGIV